MGDVATREAETPAVSGWSTERAPSAVPDPGAALRDDLVRLGGGDTSLPPPNEAVLSAAVQFVTALTRLTMLPRAERPPYATQIGALGVALDTSVGPAVEATIAPAISSGTLGTWTERSPSLSQVRTMLALLERIEAVGAVHLAGAGYEALRRLVPSRDRRAAYPLAQLARVYKTLGELTTALALYEEAAAVARSRGDVWLEGRVALGHGAALSQRGNYPAARRELERALAIAETHPEFRHPAHHMLGMAARSAGDLGTALRHDQRAFVATPDPGRRLLSLLSLGATCRQLGRHEATIRAFHAALALQPASRHLVTIRRNLLLAQASLRRWGAMRTEAAHLERLVVDATDRYEAVRAMCALAEAWLAVGDTTQGRVWGERALDEALRRGYAELRLQAEDVLARLQQWESSVESVSDSMQTGRDDAIPSLDEETDGIVRWVSALPTSKASILALR